MIGFPCVPEPSSLLWTEGLSRRAVALVNECRELLKIERPRSIESIYHDAQTLHEQGDRGGCAVILIHLSDISRAQGRLGPALKFSKKAEQLFCCWPESRYKHNYAVALYSLELVHQLLGSDNEAWDYYAKALEGFEETKRQWITLGTSDPKAKDNWGRFTRTPKGDIQFEVAFPDVTSTAAPRIIGGDDLDENSSGSIVGAFKAAQA